MTSMSTLARCSSTRWHATARQLCSRCLASTSLSPCTPRRFAHSQTKTAGPSPTPSARRRPPPVSLFPSPSRARAAPSPPSPPPDRPSARRASERVSLIDLLRPENLNAAESSTPPPPPPTPASIPPAPSATSAAPPSSDPRPATTPPSSTTAPSPSSKSPKTPAFFAPTPVPDLPPSALSEPNPIPDEEYERYRTEPLRSPPSFDDVESQVDALLDIDVHGHPMFPSYMRPTLKLRSLRHIQSILTAHFSPPSPSQPPPAPLTAHGLHTRLFTYLIKHASKLAHTDDERISIVCPDAPRVGAKVPLPQWPELTTVMRRYFTAEAEWESMEVDEERVRMQGKVRLSELFSGLDVAQVKLAAEDALIDLDDLDEAAVAFEGERLPEPSASMSVTQRQTWQAQREAREQAKVLMRNRIRALKAKRAAAKEGKAEAVMDAAMTKQGLVRQLAVVYRFDGSGEEIEMRYPLSKRDVKKLELFEEEDEAETVIE